MRGKYAKTKKRGVGGKVLLLLLALVLTVGCSVGGTLAWLIATTEEVVNTFTYGDIAITLTEDFNTDSDDEDEISDKWTGTVVPGVNLDKNPKVTVSEGSEDCYLFVKLVEGNWPEFMEGTNPDKRKVNWDIAEGWLPVPTDDDPSKTIPGVWYREVKKTDTDRAFPVLLNDQVTVSGNLTKDELKDIVKSSFTLTVSAYACQMHGDTNANGSPDDFTPAEAWAKVNPTQ